MAAITTFVDSILRLMMKQVRSPNSTRIDKVASTANTTAKVVAVIQRGGSFYLAPFMTSMGEPRCT